MSTSELRNVVSALKDKIATLASSSGATAEDMAMLGTAIEKIGGRTSMIDIMLESERIIAQLETDGTAFSAAKIAEMQAAATQALDDINALLITLTTKSAELETARDTAVSDVEAAAQTAETSATDSIAAAETESLNRINAAAAAGTQLASGMSAEILFLTQG